AAGEDGGLPARHAQQQVRRLAGAARAVAQMKTATEVAVFTPETGMSQPRTARLKAGKQRVAHALKTMAATPLFILPVLIVMPLDSEEHGRAEHDHLEGNEDDREPIPHVAYFPAVA
ncbi:MAG: hypothetical protein K2Q19_07810, partial [Rhodocyclaceae bacterium]|nr:hypothetical protein [Rhodocyclaceae bacterium]